MVPVRIQRANSGFSTGTCISCDSEPVTPTGRSSPGSMQLRGPHVARTATSPGNSARLMFMVCWILFSCSFFFKKEKKRKEEKTMSISGSHRPDSANLLVRHKRTDWYRTRSSLACHPVGVPRSDGRRAVLSPPAPRLAPCLVAKTKIPIFFSAPAWRFKSKRNKKRIATAVCKWRDESNKPN